MRATFTTTLTLLLITASALSTVACKSLQQQQRFYINQAAIQNDTTGVLHNVRLQHYPTDRVGTTTSILPKRSLDVGFDGRSMMADTGTLSWTDDHGFFHTHTLQLPVNESNDTQTKQLIYRIDPTNEVSVKIIDSQIAPVPN